MKSLKENELIQKLLSLKLPPEDFAVFGSGPLFAHGLQKDLGSDIDIIARGKAWQKALDHAEGISEDAPLNKDRVVRLFNDSIEVFDGWGPGHWSTDELINSADTFEGIKFVTLENVLKWKKMLGRPKDLVHIKILEKALDIE